MWQGVRTVVTTWVPDRSTFSMGSLLYSSLGLWTTCVPESRCVWSAW